MAPVFRYSNPNRVASAFVTVLLPTPDGPSMVTIMVSAKKSLGRGQSRRLIEVFHSPRPNASAGANYLIRSVTVSLSLIALRVAAAPDWSNW